MRTPVGTVVSTPVRTPVVTPVRTDVLNARVRVRLRAPARARLLHLAPSAWPLATEERVLNARPPAQRPTRELAAGARHQLAAGPAPTGGRAT